MSEAPLPPLAVSMGEPAGIGTEVLLKSYLELSAQGGFAFFLIDDPERVKHTAHDLGIGVACTAIAAPADAAEVFPRALPVLPVDAEGGGHLNRVFPGKPRVETAGFVIDSIRRGTELALKTQASGLVTLPIQKSVLLEAGFAFPGHTDYLGALTAGASLQPGLERGPVMMLAAGSFRTVPVTVHIPLADVARTVSADNIVHVGKVVAAALRTDFGIPAPRLAVCGLNPHAGEEGRLGDEEARIIMPAVTALRNAGIDAFGPLPGDTLFHEEARAGYDAALGMYHDQALIPIKTAAFHEAVNVTLGLPIVRTSPDHGTGLGIAGQGVARPDSTVAALIVAARMAAGRRRNVAA